MRLTRSVTSPTAKIDGTLLRDHLSTHGAALRMQGHADLLRPNPAVTGRTSERVEHHVGAHLPAVGAVADIFITYAFQPYRLKARCNSMPRAVIAAARRRRRPASNPRSGKSARKSGSRHSRSAIDACELHGDVAGAEHQQVSRCMGQIQDFAGGYRQLDAGIAGRVVRPWRSAVAVPTAFHR